MTFLDGNVYILGMLVSIGKAAEELGVTVETLRRWEAAGKIEVARTPGGHRRYDLAKLRTLAPRRSAAPAKRRTIAYARASSRAGKSAMVRQVALLESYCAANGWNVELIKDFGSGLDGKKRGLCRLIRQICSGEVGRLVLSHRDRLLRFGAELIFTLCEHFRVEVVILNASEEVEHEEDLAEDVVEIVNLFAARLYGTRNDKNREVMAILRRAAEEICAVGASLPE